MSDNPITMAVYIPPGGPEPLAPGQAALFRDWSPADVRWNDVAKGFRVELRNPAGRWVSGTGPTLCEAVWKAYESLRFWGK